MASAQSNDGTRIIYYVDEEETPYLVKLNTSADDVTLGDFKIALNKPNCKFFFKSIDDDFGVVKEEITEDSAKLPCYNGRVISWLVSAETSSGVDGGSGLNAAKLAALAGAQTALAGDDIRANSLLHASEKADKKTVARSASAAGKKKKNKEHDSDTCTEDTESVQSGQDRIAPLRSFHDFKHGGRHLHGGSHHHAHHHSHTTGGSNNGSYHHDGGRHHRMLGGIYGGSSVYDAPSSMMSSDLESTSFFESEDDSSRFSSATGTTISTRYGRQRQRRRRRRLLPISRASSFSSITDSTMSLNIITVTLNMDTVNFLGISIVGQSTKSGDDGIYVGSIMKGGAVAQDGRIEPGDMILEVNGISFEDMSNDDAVRTLREQVQQPGAITLVMAKCWDAKPRGGYFTIPRQEPVRPIDPRAWVLHTNAMTAGPDESSQGNGGSDHGGGSGSSTSSGEDSVSTLGGRGAMRGKQVIGGSGEASSSTSTMFAGTSAAAFNMAAILAARKQQQMQKSSFCTQLPPPGLLSSFPNQSVVTISSSLPESERYLEQVPLTVATDVEMVVKAMTQPDSGLEIRDRLWLKITLPKAFIGSDLVDWLLQHVEGFIDRRDCRKYASSLLKYGYIRHTVNKVTFSEQCYYVFGERTMRLSCLSLEEVDSVSEIGALTAQNWTHSTACTNLSTGGVANKGLVDNGIAAHRRAAATNNNSQTSPMSASCGGAATNQKYNTVPSPMYQQQQQSQVQPVQNGFRLSNSGGLAEIPRYQMMSEVSSSSSSSSSSESGVENIERPTPLHLLKQQQQQIQLSSAIGESMEKMKLDQSSGMQQPQTGSGGDGSVSSSSSASDVDPSTTLPLSASIPTATIRNTFGSPLGPPPPPRASPASSLYP